jgi:selenocysteine-specific elongation factor
VDRSFTLKGFGTVVTGTLVSGSLATGDELELLPSRRRARVRGLQIHGASVDRATAGHRTAVNLAGVEVGDVSRGDVLVRPGTLEATSVIDVAVSLLPGGRPLRDQARVRVHLASAEVMARLAIGGAKSIEPGGTAWGQLRLERPAVAGWGDRLILRSYSPAITIGGAQVVDPHPGRRRKREAPVRVDVAHESAAQAAVRMIRAAGASGVSTSLLAARLTIPAEEIAGLLSGHAGIVAVAREGFLARESADSLAEGVLRRLERFHADNPLRAAMPKEELRGGVFARSLDGTFEHTLSRLEAEDRVRVSADSVRLSGHEVRLTGEEEAARKALVDAAQAAGLAGLEPSRLASIAGKSAGLAERVSRVLLAEGALVRVGDALVHNASLESLKREVRRRWSPGSRLDVGEFKELTGLSRKFVIPLLEYLDRERVTRRSGENRIVLAPPPA